MAEQKSPSEIAREALRQLALQKTPPTPENYRALYNQIAGLHDKDDLAERWAELLPNLLREWKRNQQGITATKKSTAFEQAISGNSSEQALLDKLSTLTTRWSRADERDNINDSDASLVGVKQLCALLINATVSKLAGINDPLSVDAKAIVMRLQSCTTIDEIAQLTPNVKRLAFRLELAAEDHGDLNSGVLHLLRLLVDNVSELVIEDNWLTGQIAVVKDILAAPNNLRAIEDAERRIKDVIVRQSTLKSSLVEARDAIKGMLSGFVLRLADFAEETSSYHDRIESCAIRIAAADNIADLEDVVREVMQETRSIQLTAQRSRDELRQTRQRVEDAEKRVQQLQAELGKTSELVRHDQLTGALNRRGMEDIFDKEIARAARHQSPLCLAVLDVDNFKQLNDTLGHSAGDAALVHLTNVIRDTLRPQDTLTRHGGEEFIIILPDTALDAARAATIRVQRALTRRFFLHDNQKLLITFSAGVTQIPTGEGREAAIARADQLMYEAKRSGKNRVVAL